MSTSSPGIPWNFGVNFYFLALFETVRLVAVDGYNVCQGNKIISVSAHAYNADAGVVDVNIST